MAFAKLVNCLALLVVAVVPALARADSLQAPANSAAEAAAPGDRYRQLAPGVLTTVAPNSEVEDTVSRHDLVEILAADPTFGERKQSAGSSPAKEATFRHDIWGLEFSFKPIRFIQVPTPDDEGNLVKKNVWYLVYRVKNTGFEMQPSIRLLCLPSERESAWAAISRAVRTPGRAEDDIFIHGFVAPGPTFVEITGDPSVVSEELTAYEMGYRAQPSDDFSWDLAVFYNHYDNLFTNIPAGPPFFDPGLGAVIIPITFANALSANTYGAELASTYQVNCRWELTGSYTLFYADFDGTTGSANQDLSPHNRMFLRSSWDLHDDWEFDLIGRYVDNIPELGISSYLTMDVRLAWRPYKNFEWAVVGRNLLDSPHAEFSDNLAGTLATEVQPEVFTMLTWMY